MPHTPGDFYCSEKFTWLSVDLEKRQHFSCCAALPTKIDLTWLKDNPGQLFNTAHLQQERQQMLDNIPVPSCEGPCWKPERDNLVSRRDILQSYVKTHTNITVKSPEQFHIMLGSTCNLTCSYCCKQYSSAWLKDIADNGPYMDRDRFTLNKLDSILTKISQPAQQASLGFQSLLTELATFKNVKEIFITGGEPLLYNEFPKLINKLSDSNNSNITFFSGMGVNPTRFRAQLSKIKNTPAIRILISAECCDRLYEFNRYGNTWENFIINLQEIMQQGFKFEFSSVLSNLTLFGFAEFLKRFPDVNIKHEFCGDPDFLNVNVLDEQSKELVYKQIEDSKFKFKDSILSAMLQPCTDEQRQNLSVYLKQFANRRNLSLGVFPISFQDWINRD